MFLCLIYLVNNKKNNIIFVCKNGKIKHYLYMCVVVKYLLFTLQIYVFIFNKQIKCNKNLRFSMIFVCSSYVSLYFFTETNAVNETFIN